MPTRPRLRPVGRRLPNVNRRGRRKGCHEGTIFGRNAPGHAQQGRTGEAAGGKIKILPLGAVVCLRPRCAQATFAWGWVRFDD